jgi:hypothetical protein
LDQLAAVLTADAVLARAVASSGLLGDGTHWAARVSVASPGSPKGRRGCGCGCVRACACVCVCVCRGGGAVAPYPFEESLLPQRR